MTEPRDTPGIRIPPPLIPFLLILLGIGLQAIAPIIILPDDLRGIARELGWTIVLLAIALALWAVGFFVRAGTTPNPMRPTTALVVRGPYHFTRNPMYLALAAIIVGWALIANNLWILLMVIPDVIVTRVMVIDREERYLSAKFGAQYDAYRAAVRRWV